MKSFIPLHLSLVDTGAACSALVVDLRPGVDARGRLEPGAGEGAGAGEDSRLKLTVNGLSAVMASIAKELVRRAR